MSIAKGNIVVSKKHDTTGIVLAITRDSKRARVYVYGPDAEVWRPLSTFNVDVAGTVECWKCGGSGLYYFGGAVVNGVYIGKTGDCFACEGKGEQTDADRLRCFWYWHRDTVNRENLSVAPDDAETPQEKRKRKQAVADAREAVEREQPRKKVKIKSKPKRDKRSTVVQNADELENFRKPARVEDIGSRLIQCKGCGTMHRDDTMCPW